MTNQELLTVANQILTLNNYRFEFEKIQQIPNDTLNNRNDVYTMGDLNGCELLYTMATFPLNFIFTKNKLYQLF